MVTVRRSLLCHSLIWAALLSAYFPLCQCRRLLWTALDLAEIHLNYLLARHPGQMCLHYRSQHMELIFYFCGVLIHAFQTSGIFKSFG